MKIVYLTCIINITNVVNDTSRSITDESRVALHIVAPLTDDSTGVIYDRNVFIVQATSLGLIASQQNFNFYWT
jgi:hypothetical protein